MVSLKRLIIKTPILGKVALKINAVNINKKIKNNLIHLLKDETNAPRIFIFLCDTYGNLGDVALRYIQRKFLEKNFKNYNQILISDVDIRYGREILKKYIKEDDILTIVGGGNMGNQYLNTENDRRFVIENFPNNKIISFPQSIYFTDDENGERESLKSANIYNNHKNLTIVLRDDMSYEIATNLFPKVKLLLTPDIVLSMTDFKYNLKRSGVLFLTRSDVEKTVTNKEIQNIEAAVKKYYKNISYSDTIIPQKVNFDQQYEVLDKKLSQIAQAEIVVTDRLHGMIFCAITNTPCVVLSNYNHKIKYQYEWIKHLNYIHYLEDSSIFENTLLKLKSINPTTYNRAFTEPYFEEVIKVISMDKGKI